MKIHEIQVKNIADLCKLSFSEKELKSFSDQFIKMIKMFNILTEVNTVNVKTTFRPIENTNVFRKDFSIKSDKYINLINNLPDSDKSENTFILVPSVIKNNEEVI